MESPTPNSESEGESSSSTTNGHEWGLVARASRPCVSVQTNRNRNSRAGRPCHYGPSEFSRRLRELSQTVVRMNANKYEGGGVPRAPPPPPRGGGGGGGGGADQEKHQRNPRHQVPTLTHSILRQERGI